MAPNEAAATMTGTIASPSRPSVRLTALPAPTITNAAIGMKKIPRLRSTSLKNGKVSDEENGSSPALTMNQPAASAITNSAASLSLPEKPRCVCFVTLR